MNGRRPRTKSERCEESEPGAGIGNEYGTAWRRTGGRGGLGRGRRVIGGVSDRADGAQTPIVIMARGMRSAANHQERGGDSKE